MSINKELLEEYNTLSVKINDSIIEKYLLSSNNLMKVFINICNITSLNNEYQFSNDVNTDLTPENIEEFIRENDVFNHYVKCITELRVERNYLQALIIEHNEYIKEYIKDFPQDSFNGKTSPYALTLKYLYGKAGGFISGYIKRYRTFLIINITDFIIKENNTKYTAYKMIRYQKSNFGLSVSHSLATKLYSDSNRGSGDHSVTLNISYRADKHIELYDYLKYLIKFSIEEPE